MALSYLVECWLWENVNLVLLWISRVLGTRWQRLALFSEKHIEQNKCEKVDFLQIRHFFIVEMGKTSSKNWIK